MKKEILNSLLFWPRNEWKPHSNAEFFSWYGLWGANIKLTANRIKASKGIKNIKNVWLVIYGLNNIKVSIFAILNHSLGIYINSNKIKVNIEIVILKPLFNTILSILYLYDSTLVLLE